MTSVRAFFPTWSLCLCHGFRLGIGLPLRQKLISHSRAKIPFYSLKHWELSRSETVQPISMLNSDLKLECLSLIECCYVNTVGNESTPAPGNPRAMTLVHFDISLHVNHMGLSLDVTPFMSALTFSAYTLTLSPIQPVKPYIAHVVDRRSTKGIVLWIINYHMIREFFLLLFEHLREDQ